MTVQSTTSRADYTGNGVTNIFAVPFYFLDDTHLTVYRTQISTGAVSTLHLNTDYTVTGAGVSSGGEIDVPTAPTSDQKISILRNVPLTQLTHYVENDPFPAASHEDALDQLTMVAQQLQEQVNRSVKVGATDTGTTPDQLLASINTSVSTCVAQASAASASASSAAATYDSFRGQYYGSYATDPTLDPVGAAMGAGDLYFNATTGRLRVYSGLAWVDVGVASPVSVTTQTFSGNGSTTAFTLSSTPYLQAACEVYISGVSQVAGTDFTISGTTLSFTTAPPTGTNNIYVRVISAFSIGVANDASITPAKMANAGYEFGMRNRIINGDMRVAQRGTSWAVSSYTGYLLDRWTAVTVSGISSISQDVGAHWDTSTTAAIKFVASGTIAGSIQQRIESANIRDLAGQAVTLSFWAYQNSGSTQNPSVLYQIASSPDYFGGSANGPISTPSVSSGVWTKVTINWTLPATAANGINLVLGLGGALTAGQYWMFGNVQLERGAYATPFETRSYGYEFSLCQRYYQVLNGFVGFTVNATTTARLSSVLPVAMRASPSISASAALVLTDTLADFTQSVAGATLFESTQQHVSFTAQNLTGMTAFRPCHQKSSGGSILLSAEL